MDQKMIDVEPIVGPGPSVDKRKGKHIIVGSVDKSNAKSLILNQNSL